MAQILTKSSAQDRPSGRRDWMFDFLRLLTERAPVRHQALRHDLSFRRYDGDGKVGPHYELVLSVVVGEDRWIVWLDDEDCSKPPDQAVHDVLMFVRLKQRTERKTSRRGGVESRLTRKES